MSITLYTTSWNGYWDKYGTAWTGYIKRLNPQPDRILVISDKPINSEFEVIVTNKPEAAVPAHFRNIAVDAADTVFICASDVDDAPKEDLLSGLNYDYDINAFSYVTDKGIERHINIDGWNNLIDLDEYVFFFLPGTSPIKVEAIRDVGGYPNIEYEDAGIWVKLRNSNKTIYYDNKIKFIYNEIPDSFSRSGNLPHKKKQLNEWIKDLKGERHL
jgi:hypothetical protein